MATSHAAAATGWRISSNLLMSVLNSLDTGIAVFDARLKLLGCNRAYQELHDYPSELCAPGVAFAQLCERLPGAGNRGSEDAGRLAEQWLAEIRAGLRSSLRYNSVSGRALETLHQQIADDAHLLSTVDLTRWADLQARLDDYVERYGLIERAATEGIYDWRITRDELYGSNRMKEIFGHHTDDLKPGEWNWKRRVHPEDFDRYQTALHEHFEGVTDRFECEYRFSDKQQVYRWILDRGICIRDDSGTPVRFIGAISDITEFKQRQDELDRKSAILETTLETMDQGITMVDGDLRVIAFNRKFLELLDLPAELFQVGYHMEQAFRFNAERGEYGPGDVEQQVQERLDLSRRFEPHHFERVRPDGTVIEIHGTPLPNRGGFVTTYTDITERRRTEQALRSSEQRYALVTQAATEGIYQWNLEEDSLYLNDRAKEVLGFAGEAFTPKDWNDRVHPEDFNRYRRALIAHFKGHTHHHECEYRLRLEAGRFIWLLDRGIAVRSETGRVVRVVGAVSDISALKRAEEDARLAQREAERARQRLFDAIEAISEGFVMFDSDDRILVCNSTYRGYFAEAASQEVGDMVRPGAVYWDIIRAAHDEGMFPDIPPDQIEDFIERRLQTRRNPRKAVEQPLKDGRWLQINERKTEDGGIASVCTDVTALKRIERKLQEQNDRLREEIDAHGRSKATIAYLVDEIRTETNFGEIVGNSAQLQALLANLQKVAVTDSTVLVQGETGTGKELIARAIHGHSSRKDRPLVKVNCAALPRELVESELFGHEKGAFTGATQLRKGRFELADKGTLFLDEVGELPLDAQTKLLRVLQEQEFERVGGAQTLKSDVRIIAATNRDLAVEVEKGEFRSDLYYRLDVFPLTVPPLRERMDDVPLLTQHFLRKFARRLGKRFDGVAAGFHAMLMRYNWPGNVRELENVVERAAILAPGPLLDSEIDLDASMPRNAAIAAPPQYAPRTLEEVERSHIEAVLAHHGWVIEGPGGAASVLGLNPSTLRGRMRKLGIRRQA